MAIKFRRIEDRKESVVQMRRRRDEERERRRVLPKIIILIVFAVFGLGLYFWMRSPRIVAPALIRVEQVPLAAPVSGTVQWMVEPSIGRIPEGQPLARVLPDPPRGPSARARLVDLKLRATEAAAMVEERRQAARALEASLAQRETALKADLERLGGRTAVARNDLEEARRLLNERREEHDEAAPLMRVGAITNAEHSRKEKAVAAAEAAVRKAETKLEALRKERKSVRETLESFAESRKAEEKKAATTVRSAAEERQRLKEAIEEQKALMAEQTEIEQVEAPFDAVLVHRRALPHEHIRDGEPLLTLYRRGTVAARAYVRLRFRDRLSEGQSLRFYAPGLEQPIPGRIQNIHRRAEALPRTLAAGNDGDQPARIPVDVALDADALPRLMPGETGKIVITY